MMNLFKFARRGLLLAGLLALVALAAVACGDDADEEVAAPSPTPASASEAPASAGAIVIEDAWVRETAGNPGENTAIYALVTNDTAQDDTLVGAILPEGFAMAVEVHEVVPRDGNMVMQEIEGGLPVPAGETVALEPGGYHVMVMAVSERVVAGDRILVTFVFEHAGEVEVEVEARAAGAMGGMGRSH